MYRNTVSGIGRSRAAAGALHLTEPNSFVFIHVFAEKRLRWRLVTPLPRNVSVLPAPQLEILDQPLNGTCRF